MSAASISTTSIGAAVDTLLHLVLRGPVEASTVTEIWAASRGNVLFVRELVLGAIDSGRLVDQHGVWRLVGPLVTTPRLTSSSPPDSARWTRRPPTRSIGSRCGSRRACRRWRTIVGGDALEVLDRAGLLAVRADGRRQVVTLAHPLYGEILRARMPALRRRRLLLEHADRIDARGARRREDPIRSATARLEATGSADPELLVRAARLARYGHDFTRSSGSAGPRSVTA